MDTYGNKERTVCFFPEKHLLINKIEENGKACQLKRFKRSDTNDIFITDYTSVKEVKPQFLKSDMQAEFFTIATILNKKAKNDIINVKGLLYSLMPIESSTTNPILTLGTAKLSDNTGDIQLTVFASLVNEVKEDNAFSFTNMRVSRFQSDRLIKSTEQTIVTPISDDKLEISEDGDRLVKQLLHVSINSVLSSTLEVKQCCFLCKSLVEINGDLVECSTCHSIFSSSKCSTSSLVKFVVTVGETSLTLSSPSKVIEKCFVCPIKNKFQLVKKLIENDVDVKYCVTDNTVLEIKRSAA